MGACLVYDAGRIAYHDYLSLQARLVARRQEGAIPDVLVLAEHGPVLTVGRDGGADQLLVACAELSARGIAVVPVDRGGNITYHGPGQLMVYPIMDLAGQGKDLHLYLWKLEDSLIRALAGWGVTAGRRQGLPGVWASGAKVAAVGIAVSRWVTSHGAALNLDPDLGCFGLINPCGLPRAAVTSVCALTGVAPQWAEAVQAMADAFAAAFGVELETAPGEPE